MSERTGRVVPCLRTALLAVISCMAGALATHAQSHAELMRFAGEMADRGSWREARYRWESVRSQRPDDAKVLNNLAVVSEVMDDRDGALELYRQAALLAPGGEDIEENLRRFRHFWRYNHNWEPDDTAIASAASPSPAPAGEAGEHGEQQNKKKKEKSKTARVVVRLPVPPRIEVRDDEKLLVTSFRTGENILLDTNHEMVEFLRGEFRKYTPLEVLDIDPPPAIPEQTVEDLLANVEFWQYLGRNFEAGLIVSGVVSYTREDISGFRDVDVVSVETGQKVRQNQFVEQEEFRYVVDLFFMDGPTGTVRFRDRLQRAVVFQGQQNDPIAAFYTLSESIAADILAVVAPRIREDSRVIFLR